MTNLEYYNSPDEWGTYQYSSLEDVVNNYIASRNDDDYTATTPRTQIVLQAKNGARELYFDVMREIKAIELEISPLLNMTVPQDFVNIVRLSWVDKFGKLHPMAYDGRMAIAEVYLQGEDYEILFDESGEILTSGTVLNSSKPNAYRSYYVDESFTPNKDGSKFFQNGAFTFDKSNGIIQFSSDIESKKVVLEYISDGLNTQNVKIHKFAETCLHNFIYYELIKNRRNVPANEKMRARKEYFNSRRVAKKRINTIRKEDLIQVMKGASKWIK